MIVPFTYRGWWTTLHGVVLGGLFMLLLVIVLWTLLQLRDDSLTPDGAALRLRWLRRALILMAIVAWLAAVTGTFVIDPWFHAHVAGSPLTILDAHPKLTFWVDQVMEWKERIAWTSAVAASSAAYMTVYYGDELAWRRAPRVGVSALFGLAFGGALAAGVMGMLLTKIVPVT